ncbi:MAG: carbonic anhydrase [Actinomycetes bacterium]|jgi:carbonic anhydrase
MENFADLLKSNEEYASHFTKEDLTGFAQKGLAIVTCMDSRIDPLRIVGMHAGDAKILRNAGARVTEDVLRTLVLATHLLGVKRILVMPHTDCRMASAEESEIHQQIKEASGVDTRGIEIRTVRDQNKALFQDIQRIESYPLLLPGIQVMGAIYDVKTGRINPIN